MAAMAAPLIPLPSGSNMSYSGSGKPSDGPPSASSGPAANGAPRGGRNLKVLQPQQSLYGMGTLTNSLGIEAQAHPMPPPLATAIEPSERYNYYGSSESCIEYLQQLNPHQLPPNNRRQII
ncbi:hypothetical protein BGZ94_005415 [Podila epigama]|nr:hypothetical protein BGZ94_005415 [Podila epigama]